MRMCWFRGGTFLISRLIRVFQAFPSFIHGVLKVIHQILCIVTYILSRFFQCVFCS